jgi:hypothetical protein
LCIVCCILHVVRCALCVASCTLHVVRCILHAVCFACCQLACLPACLLACLPACLLYVACFCKACCNAHATLCATCYVHLQAALLPHTYIMHYSATVAQEALHALSAVGVPQHVHVPTRAPALAQVAGQECNECNGTAHPMQPACGAARRMQRWCHVATMIGTQPALALSVQGAGQYFCRRLAALSA